MSGNPNDIKDQLLMAMLPHVLFDGWSQDTLAAACQDLGPDTPEASLVFPGGIRDVAKHFGDYMDRAMLAELAKLNIEKLPIRERIATGVRTRLMLLAPHREAIRRLLTYLSLPGNQFTGLRITMKTVDAIWYAAGDTATDFNYYTKRGLLAGVYGSTILYWLSDNSDDFVETDAFLARRINEVLQIPKLQSKITKRLERLTRPLRRFKRPAF
ncbi:MAG: COQ9 family protein [Rhodospirillaceae bacterium]|nr:COQ9 family protein [Rhodospirillaceae bacterium]MBT5940344.1 COQ9 family protein [Rhodospirillaceae bacterium]